MTPYQLEDFLSEYLHRFNQIVLNEKRDFGKNFNANNQHCFSERNVSPFWTKLKIVSQSLDEKKDAFTHFLKCHKNFDLICHQNILKEVRHKQQREISYRSFHADLLFDNDT